MFYYYSDIVYIDIEKSKKKKTLIFVTNKGHVRYLVLDKEQILLDTLIEKCNNLLTLEKLKKKYPEVKI